MSSEAAGSARLGAKNKEISRAIQKVLKTLGSVRADVVRKSNDLNKKHKECVDATQQVTRDLSENQATLGQIEDLVRSQMGAAASLQVPLDVSVGQGLNWQAAGH